MPDVKPGDESSSPPRDATFMQVVGAVFWSFFGVRKKSAMSRDVTSVKPQHVIIIGILMAAIFVGTLIVIVRLITAGT
jgi:hypothetical protein